MVEYKVKSIKYNFIMNIILTVSNFLFPLLTFPYVSRVLQVEANGKVAFVSSVVSYFMMIGSLGIPTYGIRAASRVRDNKKKLSIVVQELLIINFCLVAVVLSCYFVAILNIKTFYEYRELFYINSVGILLNVLGMNWFFQATEQYDYITIRSIVFRIISIILLFTLRERIHEFGILMSVGISRKEIIAQILLELYTVAATSSIFALMLGSFVAKQFYTGLLTSDEIPPQVKSLFESSLPEFSLMQGLLTIGVVLIIIALAVLFSTAVILMKKPKKILSQMN